MRKKRFNLLISILVGIAIFGFFIYKLGPEAITLIIKNINPFYLIIFFAITSFSFFPVAWRWQIILKAYKKKIPFLILLRQTIAGFAVGYITPSVRLGGEPLRAYMLKKEARVDLRTGSSSIIMDKFIELAGTAIFGLVGLVLLMYIPGVSFLLKFILAFLIVFTFSFLLIFYYRTVTKKGSFSSLFNLLRLYKIARFSNFVKVLEDVEKRLERFFIHHKKEFLLGFLMYFLYGVVIIFEMKFLLLSFGINVSVTTLFLSLIVLGIANFIPVPAALGFFEAGQSGLFKLLEGSGSIGFALCLMVRLRSLLFVSLGFALISHFSGKQIGKVFKKTRY